MFSLTELTAAIPSRNQSDNLFGSCYIALASSIKKYISFEIVRAYYLDVPEQVEWLSTVVVKPSLVF